MFQVRGEGDHGGVPDGCVRDVSPVHCRGHHPGKQKKKKIAGKLGQFD